MEEETLNMLSRENLNKNEESSDSNCSIYMSHPCKRSRVERFKGVVPQQNGHWGAQIYVNHHRIWLGTFKSEIDAAMAYDTAAIKLRSGDSHRNFPWTGLSTVQEPKFQSHFTTDAVFNMIRDGSYPSKFAEFLRNQKGEIELGLNLSSVHGDGQFSCTLLFEKELTPSDVGKLNRLVIPKRQMRLWKFRYCYWKSSQSFVFTRGWNRFVKEKCLTANDTISFYMYESCGGRNFGRSFLVIDKAHKGSSRIEDTTKEKTFHGMMASTPRRNIQGIRLFGVQID